MKISECLMEIALLSTNKSELVDKIITISYS